jgi:hypothetical protein
MASTFSVTFHRKLDLFKVHLADFLSLIFKSLLLIWKVVLVTLLVLFFYQFRRNAG